MSRYPAWWLQADGVPAEYLDDWAESRVCDTVADAETDARLSDEPDRGGQ